MMVRFAADRGVGAAAGGFTAVSSPRALRTPTNGEVAPGVGSSVGEKEGGDKVRRFGAEVDGL